MLIINDLLKEKERRTILLSFELLTRLELVTSSLPRKCSTTELQQQLSAKSRAKVMLFFISAKFGANKMRIKCCLCSKKTIILPAESRFYNTEHQPRHKEGNNDIEALRTEESVEDITVIFRNDILQASIHTDTDKCQREEECREGLCHRCFGQLLRLPIGKYLVALQEAEYQRCKHKAKHELREFLPYKA